jgi:hypothetical protein
MSQGRKSLTLTESVRSDRRGTLKKAWRVQEVIPAPTKPQRLPVVLSLEEVLRFLSAVPSVKHRAILTTCYAAELRISEALRLRPTDVDVPSRADGRDRAPPAHAPVPAHSGYLMIAIPASHRPADTLAGTAAQPWCALGTARGTDRPSSGVVDASMSPWTDSANGRNGFERHRHR